MSLINCLVCRLNLDSTWSETGDRYLLKLFRDYILHPCADDGRPWIDLAHVVACLNRLDAASQDKVGYQFNSLQIFGFLIINFILKFFRFASLPGINRMYWL